MRTQQQQEFYNRMAKKKPKIRKVKEPKVWKMEEISTIQYMRNCMYWIEEYLSGGTDESRFKSALKSLREHTYKIELENKH